MHDKKIDFMSTECLPNRFIDSGNDQDQMVKKLFREMTIVVAVDEMTMIAMVP